MDVVIAQATSKRESEGEIGQDRPELPKDREMFSKIAKCCERLRKIPRGFFHRGALQAPFCAHKQFLLVICRFCLKV